MRLTSVEFNGCTFTSAVTNSIPFWSVPDITFTNNIVSATSSSDSITVFIDNDRNITTNILVENNLIRNDNPSGIVLTVGGDPATYPNTIGGAVRKNRFIHRNDHTAHGFILLNQNVGTDIKWNYLDGTPVNGYKSTNGDDYSTSLWSYNIFKDGAMLAKGVDHGRFFNCTSVITENFPDVITNLSMNSNVGVNSDYGVVKNNIFVYLGVDSWYMMILGGTGQEIDYNLYYCPNATLKFQHNTVDKTWEEWQALGFDTHSRVLTDEEYEGLFTDPDNGDFSLKNGSVAIGFGTDLGASYNEGLDASTDWGDDSTIPTVVTKTQGGSWDVGAYIH